MERGGGKHYGFVMGGGEEGGLGVGVVKAYKMGDMHVFFFLVKSFLSFWLGKNQGNREGRGLDRHGLYVFF